MDIVFPKQTQTWPTWGPPGSCRSQVAPYWPHEPCYQGNASNRHPELMCEGRSVVCVMLIQSVVISCNYHQVKLQTHRLPISQDRDLTGTYDEPSDIGIDPRIHHVFVMLPYVASRVSPTKYPHGSVVLFHSFFRLLSIYPCILGLSHWHRINRMIAPMPSK